MCVGNQYAIQITLIKHEHPTNGSKDEQNIFFCNCMEFVVTYEKYNIKYHFRDKNTSKRYKVN